MMPSLSMRTSPSGPAEFAVFETANLRILEGSGELNKQVVHAVRTTTSLNWVGLLMAYLLSPISF